MVAESKTPTSQDIQKVVWMIWWIGWEGDPDPSNHKTGFDGADEIVDWFKDKPDDWDRETNEDQYILTVIKEWEAYFFAYILMRLLSARKVNTSLKKVQRGVWRWSKYPMISCMFRGTLKETTTWARRECSCNTSYKLLDYIMYEVYNRPVKTSFGDASKSRNGATIPCLIFTICWYSLHRCCWYNQTPRCSSAYKKLRLAHWNYSWSNTSLSMGRKRLKQRT